MHYILAWYLILGHPETGKMCLLLNTRKLLVMLVYSNNEQECCILMYRVYLYVSIIGRPANLAYEFGKGGNT